jgi:4-diphosphocytidyl-2-C-methyl-D-erythritol kinase
MAAPFVLDCRTQKRHLWRPIMFEPGKSVEIKAPAKVNLFLEVCGRRPDGYHDLESIFQAVSIYDNLLVTAAPGRGINLTCDVSELETESNLAYKAAAAFLNAAGVQARVDIHLEKTIPMQAGLGGGSSDAAAVLVALNELAASPFSDDDLRAIGAEIGSDVPFFVDGGTALVEGRGEKVTPIDSACKFYFVILYPGFGVSTASVYKNLRLNLTKKVNFANVLSSALSRGNLEEAQEFFFNRLEETAFALDERLCTIKAAMQSHLGGTHVLLCGSGASLLSAFAVYTIAFGGYRALKEANAGVVFLAESIRGRRRAATLKGDGRGYQRR